MFDIALSIPRVCFEKEHAVMPSNQNLSHFHTPPSIELSRQQLCNHQAHLYEHFNLHRTSDPNILNILTFFLYSTDATERNSSPYEVMASHSPLTEKQGTSLSGQTFLPFLSTSTCSQACVVQDGGHPFLQFRMHNSPCDPVGAQDFFLTIFRSGQRFIFFLLLCLSIYLAK
jgi:hypothetical protein